jgi:ribosomal protein S27E
MKTNSNVLSLQAKKDRSCEHKHVDIDESLTNVLCRDCGKELNPMWVLYRFATDEKTMHDRLKKQKHYQDILSDKLNKKQRTKCSHCGKMTEVNININYSEIMKKERNEQ